MQSLLFVPFDLADATHFMPWLAEELMRVFSLEANVSSNVPSFSNCWDAARRQYDAHWLLRELSKVDHTGPVLGLTGRDLFVPVFTFVLGEAELGGRAAVVSTARLGDSLPAQANDSWRSRLLKEAIHEIAHCYGLLHCRDSRCVMFAAAAIEDLDLKSERFCDDCGAELSLRKRERRQTAD